MTLTMSQKINTSLTLLGVLAITCGIHGISGVEEGKEVKSLCEIPETGKVKKVGGEVTQISEGGMPSSNRVTIEEKGNNCGTSLNISKREVLSSGIKIGDYIVVSGEASLYGVTVKDKRNININPAEHAEELSNIQSKSQYIYPTEIKRGGILGVFVLYNPDGGWFTMTNSIKDKVNESGMYRIKYTSSLDIVDVEKR